MRKLLLVLWLLLPIVGWAYHEGPGQDRMQLDEVARLLDEASIHAKDEVWLLAIETYEKALEELPAAYVNEARRIRLERDKAWMQVSKLPEAHGDLVKLVEELQGDENAESTTLAEARSSLANAKYYLTWLMRLEGLPRETWEPEIEAARQTQRLLAEQARERGDQDALKKHSEDLESTIRLARLSLDELQGLPLPSQ
ncbi:MAG: hypothetical protein H6833_06145 [Planctomycetes bacterium]|nr:hypothetical protein [Planctomycetota bacterium]